MPKHVDDPETTRRTQAFTDLLCAELGIDRELAASVSSPVLATVGQVAHGAARPAGAMSAFLVGLALGREAAGQAEAPSEEEVRTALTRVRETVRRFEEREAADAGAASESASGAAGASAEGTARA